MKLYVDPDEKKHRLGMKKKTPEKTGARLKKTPVQKRGTQRSFLEKFFLKTVNFLFLCFVWGGIGTTLLFLWFSKGIPDLSSLTVNSRRPSVTVQTEDGTILSSYGDVYEDMILVSELPDYVPKALMAVEDRRFEYHFGVDIIGLVRAFYANFQARRIVQGGSTLTQQLAKNILQTYGAYDMQDRSYERKIQEVLIALWLEWKFTKSQIMTMYLNRVCFGGTIYGIDAAARIFFNKSARHLTVFEAALIAGLLQAPSRYSPVHNPKNAINRATVVLKLMQEAGFIEDFQQYVKQGEIDLANIQMNQGKGGKYFADWVFESLQSYLGPITKDIIVTTTLDPVLQRHAEMVVKHYNETMGKQLKASQIAFVAMSPDGAVKAMIGGRNYSESQFNRVTQAKRQPGSAFKTFVYLTAMDAGMDPMTLIDDTPITINNWSPSNYKYVSQGLVSLREAFMRSVNSVSVRLTEKLGIDAVAETAERLGLMHCARDGLSISLGTTHTTLLELTAAHAAFANRGYRVVPYGVLEIRDKEGNILFQQMDVQSTKIIHDKSLEKMRDLLRSVVESGSGRAANIDESVSGKTGSNGDRDAWFIFYREATPDSVTGFTDLVGGVWVGNDLNTPMDKSSTGGRIPTRVARDILLGPNYGLKNLDTTQAVKPPVKR